MVQWNRFRGALRRGLESGLDHPLTVADLARLSEGVLDQEILGAFLDGKCHDLPEGYIEALGAISELGLRRRDYLPNESQPVYRTEPKSSVKKTTAQREVIKGISQRYDRMVKFRKEIGLESPDGAKYILLRTRDPSALPKALTNRIKRAACSRIELGKRFGHRIRETGAGVRNQEFGHFYEKDGVLSFPHRLQDSFWEMCEFLNQRICDRENVPASQQPSTREFVVALLQDGKIEGDHNADADALERIHLRRSGSKASELL